jgi:polyisoprenoid-binding protein YceI
MKTMITHTYPNAECTILTFKEGLLSAVAHDLKLRVERFEVQVDGETAITAKFDTRSIRVVCAVKSGQDVLSTLSDKDRRQVEENMAKDVLASEKSPEILFTSTQIAKKGSGYYVKGNLKIRNKQVALEFDVVEKSGRLVTEVTLNQPDFGIKPFSAMMGTIKIKPEIKIQISIPK